MDEQKSKGPEFKVVDKRRFSEAEEDREEKLSEKGGQNPKAESSAAEKESGQDIPPDRPATEDAWQSRRGVDFSGFVLGMATQALMFLGEIPNPESNLVSMNLAAAKETIDILGMLEEKTKGNLTEEEHELLENVLAQVRLTFVQKINQG